MCIKDRIGSNGEFFILKDTSSHSDPDRDREALGPSYLVHAC